MASEIGALREELAALRHELDDLRLQLRDLFVSASRACCRARTRRAAGDEDGDAS